MDAARVDDNVVSVVGGVVLPVMKDYGQVAALGEQTASWCFRVTEVFESVTENPEHVLQWGRESLMEHERTDAAGPEARAHAVGDRESEKLTVRPLPHLICLRPGSINELGCIRSIRAGREAFPAIAHDLTLNARRCPRARYMRQELV